MSGEKRNERGALPDCQDCGGRGYLTGERGTHECACAAEVSGLAGIAQFSDGSGKASDEMAYQMMRMDERQHIVEAQRVFVLRHSAVLAGINWEASAYGLEIILCCNTYRGKRSSAVEIARLWPDLDWKRVEPWLSMDKARVRDWAAEYEGVTLRIREAEVYAVRPQVEPWRGKGESVDLKREGGEA